MIYHQLLLVFGDLMGAGLSLLVGRQPIFPSFSVSAMWCTVDAPMPLEHPFFDPPKIHETNSFLWEAAEAGKAIIPVAVVYSDDLMMG